MLDTEIQYPCERADTQLGTNQKIAVMGRVRPAADAAPVEQIPKPLGINRLSNTRSHYLS
jgi:hypothetical protein